MTVIAWLLLILSSLVGVLWLGRHVKLTLEKKRTFLLTDAYPGPPMPAPRVSLIVAAKEEEHNIETCIEGLLSQDYPNFEVIAVNDRSDDATGKILDKLAEQHGQDRLKVIHVEQLPDGWKGKNHALHQAVQIATGEYLFFTDADCRQTSTRTISVAMQKLSEEKTGMLTMLPNLEMVSFWENVVQPICSGVMMIWFEPRRVNLPESSSSYANGAFILIRRDVYDAIGGHEAIADELQEDMILGQRVKSGGHGLSVLRSDGLYSVRMYTSLRQIHHGWTRIFYGSFETIPRLAISFWVVLLMGLTPLAAIGMGLCNWSAGEVYRWCVPAGIFGQMMQLTMIFRFYSLIHARKWLSWLYPLGSVVVLGILLAAIGKHRRGAKVTWKNTAYTK